MSRGAVPRSHMSFDLLDTRGRWLGSLSATSIGTLRRSTPSDFVTLTEFWKEGIALDLRTLRCELREWLDRHSRPELVEPVLAAARKAKGVLYISEGEPDARGTHPGFDEEHRPVAWAVERRRLSCSCGVLVNNSARWRERSTR